MASSLKITRGTTYTIGFSYQRNGVAASLVGATLRFTVKASEYDSDITDATAVISKNVTSGTAGGNATITINPSDTATLAPGKYYYDIKVQEAGGAIYKCVEGTITIDGSPTNRVS